MQPVRKVSQSSMGHPIVQARGSRNVDAAHIGRCRPADLAPEALPERTVPSRIAPPVVLFFTSRPPLGVLPPFALVEQSRRPPASSPPPPSSLSSSKNRYTFEFWCPSNELGLVC